MSESVYNWKDLSIIPEDGLTVESSAIAQAIFNIINISTGELLFNPEFGCDLELLLFEPIDNITASHILTIISRCIGLWDSRIQVARLQSSVIPNYDSNRYEVNLVLRLLGADRDKFFNFSFFLDKYR